ncbi:MAG: LacI family DNA-binding transcriptional regulator [Planctomycetota bacterium]
MSRTTPRLIDIAHKAELSVTSISRILAGQRLSEYSQTTQDRVRKIAEELGWRPNLVVQGMKTGKTNTFGVFIAPYDTYWTGVLYGIHDTLLDAKQVPLVLWPHALVHPTIEPDVTEVKLNGQGSGGAASSSSSVPPGASGLMDGSGASRRELDRINCLEDRRVDAIISWPLHEGNARDRLAMLSTRGLPVVTIDDMLPEPAKSIYVGTDEDVTMTMIREHLESLGHRRVIYIGIKRDHTWARRRKDAFFKAWPECDPRCAIDLDTDDDRCHAQVKDFVRSQPEATAVVAASDHVARQITRALEPLGKRVPDDLAIVGYGNDVFGKGDVPLTTIDQRPYEVGQAAARLALKSKKPHKRSFLIKTRLLVRESTRSA